MLNLAAWKTSYVLPTKSTLICVGNFGTSGRNVISALPLSDRFHGFEFKVKFFASKNTTQIELPKLASESECGPTLIQVSDEFQTDGASKIGKRHICSKRF